MGAFVYKALSLYVEGGYVHNLPILRLHNEQHNAHYSYAFRKSLNTCNVAIFFHSTNQIHKHQGQWSTVATANKWELARS